MRFGRAKAAAVIAGLGLAVAGASAPRPAEACGGFFLPRSERVQVKSRRLAVALSPTETVLWDQLEYDGDPSEFAWVVPAPPGSRVELASDDWFAALDASTAPVVYEPRRYGRGSGCALTGCAAETSAGETPPGVTVVRQTVVGPYATVTLAGAGDPEAAIRWLGDNGFNVPASVAPTLRAYAAEGYEFVALKLRPFCVRAMRPVRLVMPKANAVVPLRMAAVGAAARVPVTVFVLADGRVRPTGYADVPLDLGRLSWDGQGRSSYEALVKEALGRAGGKGFVTEYADRPSAPDRPAASGGRDLNPTLADGYLGLCGRGTAPPSERKPAEPCVQVPFDAGVGKPDAASGDAGDAGDAGAPLEDAGPAPRDAGTGAPDAGAAGASCDDLDVATRRLRDPWLTRLRGDFSPDALTLDLAFEREATQRPVSNVHQALAYKNEPEPRYDAVCGRRLPRRERAKDLGGLAAVALGVLAWLRRRGR